MRLKRLFSLICAGVLTTSSLSLVASATPVGPDNLVNTEVESSAESTSASMITAGWHEVSKQTFWVLDALEEDKGWLQTGIHGSLIPRMGSYGLDLMENP